MTPSLLTTQPSPTSPMITAANCYMQAQPPILLLNTMLEKSR